jgi:hypothetical protein
MIILDTNVISEPMKPHAHPTVVAWLDRQEPESLYLTATTLSEILFGIAVLPDGKRKRTLSDAMQKMLSALFADRFLAFDRNAANAYASLMSRSMAAGSSVSIADGQIAAIAAVHGYTVATRDTGPFVACSIPVTNPWESTPSES